MRRRCTLAKSHLSWWQMLCIDLLPKENFSFWSNRHSSRLYSQSSQTSLLFWGAFAKNNRLSWESSFCADSGSLWRERESRKVYPSIKCCLKQRCLIFFVYAFHRFMHRFILRDNKHAEGLLHGIEVLCWSFPPKRGSLASSKLLHVVVSVSSVIWSVLSTLSLLYFESAEKSTSRIQLTSWEAKISDERYTHFILDEVSLLSAIVKEVFITKWT